MSWWAWLNLAAGIAWAQRAMAARPDRLDVLRRLRVPALVLRGEDDAVSSHTQMSAMAEALGTTLVEIPRAGHRRGGRTSRQRAGRLKSRERSRAAAPGSDCVNA